MRVFKQFNPSSLSFSFNKEKTRRMHDFIEQAIIKPKSHRHGRLMQGLEVKSASSLPVVPQARSDVSSTEKAISVAVLTLLFGEY